MGSLARIRTDVSSEQEGVWVNYEHGIRLKIARIGNPSWKKFIRKNRSLDQTLELMNGNGADADRAEEQTMEAVAHTVLTGWEGVTDDDDNEIPYSPEKALEFFQSPALRDFYTDVIGFANNRNLYRERMRKETAGNSESA